MKKSTDELSKILENKKNRKDLDEYLSQNRENFSNQTFAELLEQTLKENKVSKTDAVKRSHLENHYAYEIFRGTKDKNLSRNKIIMLCIGMEADLEQTRKLLLKKQYAPLYPKNERDSIIIFGLQRKLSVMDINNLLYDKGFEILD
ncbi:MAG: hypothetical protein PUG48_04930 [Clostridia bacterium]|nr:hypothetical protein [Clostridia bacterium]